METCSNCRQELQPGYDFCHHCGAAALQHGAAEPAQSNLVGLVGDLEQITTRSVAASTTASQAVNDWLGSPASTQRRIFYALLTGLAVVLASGVTPLSGPFKWLEAWLLLSLLVLPLISYWLTGFIPFSNIVNTILGDALSLRRRLAITFLWTTFSPLTFLGAGSVWVRSGLSDTGGLQTLVESLGVYAGSFLITFYLMGHATSWRPVSSLEGSLFLDRMAKDANQVSALIRDQVRQRNIRNLETVEIEMAKLRRYTAGESSGRQGQQLCFTTGRSQVVLFVQDFGHSLFIRWVCYFDASGRRLWVFFGLILSGLTSFIGRWTGSNLAELWRDYMNVLRPTSRSNLNLMAMIRGGILSRLFGMAEGVSEYGWNELYALESSIKETVIEVAGSAQEEHEESDAIQAQIERHSRFEAMAQSVVRAGAR